MGDFFQAIQEKRDRLASINQNVLVNTVLNRPEFKEFIIERNTRNQLFELNIDSRGIRLNTIGGDYAPRTIQDAIDEGRPKKSPQDINLFNEGDYYESYVVTISSFADAFFTISSNPEKEDNNLEDDWGEHLEGLTEENIERLRDRVLEELLPLIIAAA